MRWINDLPPVCYSYTYIGDLVLNDNWSVWHSGVCFSLILFLFMYEIDTYMNMLILKCAASYFIQSLFFSSRLSHAVCSVYT